MKKFMAIVLAFVMSFSLAACNGGEEAVTQPENEPSETAEQQETEPAETETEPEVVEREVYTAAEYEAMSQAEILAMIPDIEPSGEVIVGSNTQPNSDIMFGWTNLTPNAGMKYMMYYGYRMVILTDSGQFIYNPVAVENVETEDHADGSKTFTISIYDNLVWNDGTGITSKDYLFYIMLYSSPQFAELDASATEGLNISGYEEFNTGAATKFEGLHYIDDYTLAITIAAENLPYFHEKTYLAHYPLPMHVLAPGVDILDDGTGCEFTEEFTTELIRETISDPDNGYRYKPMVSAGPYQFVSYDDVTHTGVMEANPTFLGNYDGTKPQIKTIVVKHSSATTQINELEAGDADLIFQVTTGTRIEAGLDVVDKGLADYTTYYRNGYGFVKFHCDFGPTQFAAVRQALCLLLDRDEFARQYSGGYAVTVDSRYGLAQWEYQESRDELAGLLSSYSYNPERAKELLIEDGWVLNASGGDFDENVDAVRYKEVDGELMKLQVNWASSTDNAVTDLLNIMLPDAAASIGIEIEQTMMESVLDFASRRGVDEPYYHMFNQGLGFSNPDTPWYQFSSDPRFLNGVYNSNFIVDEQLNDIVQSMKLTDPSDKEGYRQKWLQYQVRWNELVPDIPLYSDNYHDFFNPKIKDYTPTSEWMWYYALQRARVEG